MRFSKQEFVRSQGCADPSLYSALMFQPRVITILVAAGIVFQTPVIFAALGAVLAWSSLLPQLNPFDAVYSAWSGNRRIVAPAPRRFAQAMAASMTIAIGVTMSLGPVYVAIPLQALAGLSVVAAVVFRACLPSNIYIRLIAAGVSHDTTCVAR